MIKVPELTKERADNIAKTAVAQLRTSRQYKIQRMKQIAESEDLYFGIVKKTIRNPFNESFPFMSGFVDHLLSKIDDMPIIEIKDKDEADYIRAKKYQALYDQESTSTAVNAQWALKDRWSKKFAAFSGVGTYSISADSYEGGINFNLETHDYYDFHAEPGGGGDLEGHLFYGIEGTFKTEQELLEGAKEGYYDEEQVALIVSKGNASDYKQNEDDYNQRLNRHRGLGLDPQSNNYTGQLLFKLVRWYLTYEGVRYYCLFEEATGQWIRVKALRDMFKPERKTGEALWPCVAWHTHEDARVFWSKAPCDDARPMALTVNRLLNQELYNREKKNTGQRAYDPEMYHDLEALQDWRPDGLVPFDSKGGTRSANQGIYTFNVGEIGGTIDLVQFLDGFTGQKTGTTPGSQGAAPRDQKVGIFFGEMKAVEGRMNLYNKSYKNAREAIAYRFINLVDEYLTEEIEVEIMGANGPEWAKLTPEDKKRARDFGITISGGEMELQEEQAKNARKLEILKSIQTANPEWKDTELMKIGGWTDAEIKEAFSSIPQSSRELMSEAKQACDMIAKGKVPPINNGADVMFLDRINTIAQAYDGPIEKQLAMYDYALQHSVIAAKNQARKANQMMIDKKIQMFNQAGATPMGPKAGGGGFQTTPNMGSLSANPATV